MVELLKNERKMIKRNEGKFVFVLNQEQLYEPEAKDNIVDGWKKEIESKEEWLKNKDAIMQQGINELKGQFEKMEEQIENDIKSLKEAVEIWEKA